MCIKIRGLTLKISPAFAVFFAVTANIFQSNTYLLSMLFSLFHESVHLLSLFLCRCGSASLEFLPGGIRLSSEGFLRLPYSKTVFCTLSAPVMNIFAGALFYAFFCLSGNRILSDSAFINFLIGGVNLLPMPFLDGGRAFRAVLSMRFDCFKVRNICTAVSLFSLSFLFMVFFICFCMKKYYLFLLFFFIYCAFGCICDKS